MKKNLVKLLDTSGNESFALRISMPTKDYTPSKKKVRNNDKGVRKNA